MQETICIMFFLSLALKSLQIFKIHIKITLLQITLALDNTKKNHNNKNNEMFENELKTMRIISF